MQFQLTAAGLAAGVAAQQGGYDLVFGNFTVGSAYGYTPSPTDTGLHGTTLYTGQITGFANNNGVLQFMANLDLTVGDFLYGEMALWLANGTLFALGSLPALQEKYAKPSVNANQILETINVTWAGAVPQITWVVSPTVSTNLLEYANFDLVPPPAVAPVNAAIVHFPDDFGNQPLVYTQGSSHLWQISTHDYVAFSDTVAAATVGSNSFISSVSHNNPATPSGRYLIQFTSGNSKGLVRPVTVINGTTITMDTALGIANGDSFTVYQSTMSYMTIAAQQAAQQGRTGEIRIWSGTATEAAVVSAWGPGWHFCNGSNGTPDLRDKFIAGAGGAYAVGATGGTNSNVLTVNQLPSHSHTVNDSHSHTVFDPGHSHGFSQGYHSHGVYDPGHSHTWTLGTLRQSGGDTSCYVPRSLYGGGEYQFTETTAAVGTGVSIAAALAGGSVNGNYTGVTVQTASGWLTVNSTGLGQAVENRPPFYALSFVMYTGV